MSAVLCAPPPPTHRPRETRSSHTPTSAHYDGAAGPATATGRDALEGKGPQRQPQRRLGRRLEEVAKAVGGGYCRLQMPLRLALGVRETVAGHGLGALEGGYPLPMHPWPRARTQTSVPRTPPVRRRPAQTSCSGPSLQTPPAPPAPRTITETARGEGGRPTHPPGPQMVRAAAPSSAPAPRPLAPPVPRRRSRGVRSPAGPFRPPSPIRWGMGRLPLDRRGRARVGGPVHGAVEAPPG